MPRPADSSPPPPRRRDFDPLALVTLAGVVGTLMMSFASMRDISRIDQTLTSRLTSLETQVAQVSDRVGRTPAQAPAQQGPDPNRVYTLKLDDVPLKGPASAPITIAEFSDFQ